MDLDAVTDRVAICAAVVLPSGKAESFVMRKGGAQVADWEYRRYPLQGAHEHTVSGPVGCSVRRTDLPIRA